MHGLKDMREGLGPGEVEHELLARQRRTATVRPERPVGVRTIEIAVRADHFRLEPQAELQPEGVHVVGERLEPVRIFALVDRPIAERRSVRITPAEPAIVEHEALDAELRRSPRLAHKMRHSMCEIIAFPGVERHRPRRGASAGQRIVARRRARSAAGSGAKKAVGLR